MRSKLPAYVREWLTTWTETKITRSTCLVDYRLHGSTEARDIVVVAAAVNGSATLFYLMTMHGMRAANSHAAQLLKHTHPTTGHQSASPPRLLCIHCCCCCCGVKINTSLHSSFLASSTQHLHHWRHRYQKTKQRILRHFSHSDIGKKIPWFVWIILRL